MRINKSTNRNSIFAWPSKLWRRGLFLCFCVFVFHSVYLYNIKPLYAGVDFISFRHTNNLEKKKKLAEKFLDKHSPYIDNFRLRFGNEVFFKAISGGDAEYVAWSYNAAIKEMKKASKRHPNDFSYLHTLGNLYLRGGNAFDNMEYYNQAVKFYKKALELSPKRQAVIFQLSTCYLFMGESRKAVESLKEAVSFDEKIGQSHWRLGVALLASGQKQEAYKSLKRSIKLEFFGRIEDEVKKATNLCIENKDYKCAAILYRSLKVNPETAEFYVLLAEAYFEIESYGDAKDSIGRAVELDQSLKKKAEMFLKQIGY